MAANLVLYAHQPPTPGEIVQKQIAGKKDKNIQQAGFPDGHPL
jgi:hypothetical protein